jgi:hypothetical protein
MVPNLWGALWSGICPEKYFIHMYILLMELIVMKSWMLNEDVEHTKYSSLVSEL